MAYGTPPIKSVRMLAIGAAALPLIHALYVVNLWCVLKRTLKGLNMLSVPLNVIGIGYLVDSLVRTTLTTKVVSRYPITVIIGIDRNDVF